MAHDAEQEYRVVQRALAQHGQGASPSLSLELDALFGAHAPSLAAYCRRMVGDPQRAAELAQEAQLIAYAKLADFEEGRRFSTWVHGIARHLCLRALEKKKELLADDGVLEGVDDDAQSTLRRMHAEERAALIRQAAADVLDEQEQKAVHLRYVVGMSQEGITLALHLDGTGGRGLLQRCRRKLGKAIAVRLAEAGHGRSFFDSIG
ncbi:MAG: sigma-70 family RNA polymerase sigma factor [Myxococcota bacterium]